MIYYVRTDVSERIDVSKQLIKEVHQNSVIFVAIGTFLMKGLSFSQMFAMGVMMC